MEQMTKQRSKSAEEAVQELPDADVAASQASAEAEDLLAELDALLAENDAVIIDAEEAQTDYLSRWDEEAKLVEQQSNPFWELHQDNTRFSLCGC